MYHDRRNKRQLSPKVHIEMEMNHKDHIIRLLLGAVVSRAIYVAAELGVADLIKDQPKDSQTIADEIDANPKSLYRLMRMLAGHNIFREEDEGKFSLTPLGECLTSDHPDSLRAFICQEDEPRWRSIGRLKSSVINGLPAFDQIYGKNYFEYLAVDPKMNYRFELGMSNLTIEEDELIANILPAGDANTLVDVGGGRGGFIAEILKKNPSLHGILFELPHVVFPKDDLLLNGVEKRCEIVSGSFFESVPKGSDIYTLKRVLHDWNDRSGEMILKNCRNSMPPGGKVMVVEAIVPEGNGSDLIKDVDVYMMALFPGRERTEGEFRSLFDSAGLKLTNIIPTKSDLSIIEGVAV